MMWIDKMSTVVRLKRSLFEFLQQGLAINFRLVDLSDCIYM